MWLQWSALQFNKPELAKHKETDRIFHKSVRFSSRPSGKVIKKNKTIIREWPFKGQEVSLYLCHSSSVSCDALPCLTYFLPKPVKSREIPLILWQNVVQYWWTATWAHSLSTYIKYWISFQYSDPLFSSGLILM